MRNPTITYVFICAHRGNLWNHLRSCAMPMARAVNLIVAVGISCCTSLQLQAPGVGATPRGQSSMLVAGSTDKVPEPPHPALLMTIAGLQSACFGCIGTALPPALRAAGLTPSDVALLLGRIGSCSALCEVMLSGSFGKLADAIGRKPILLGAPLLTVSARALVVVRPTLSVLLGARLLTTIAVPM